MPRSPSSLRRRLLPFVLGCEVLGTVLAPAALGHADAAAEEASTLAVPVAVLALDADDAEEQADALTGALKSRIRASEGLSLVESSASLAMLTAALKCPPRPTPECQDKIADQIKANAYVFGVVSKGPKGQVTAEVQLYQRGLPVKTAKETYASQLKDANDDALRAVAGKLLDAISGAALGTIVVRAAAPATEVVIDGQRHVTLANGAARVPIAPGSHSVETLFDGAPEKRTVKVEAGKESGIELASSKKKAEQAKIEEEGSGVPGRKVLGVVAMGVGVGLGAFAVERALRYGEMQDQVKDSRFQQAIDDTGGRSVPACEATGPGAEQACNVSKNAQGVSTAAIALGAGSVLALGAGVYLFFFGGDSTEKGARASARPQLVPVVGKSTTGLGLSGSF